MPRTKGADNIELRYQAAMSFDEIAMELGVSRQYVAVYYRRAMNKLRKRNIEDFKDLLQLAKSKHHSNL